MRFAHWFQAAAAMTVIACQRPVRVDSGASLSPTTITIVAPLALDGRGAALTNVRLVIDGSKIVRVDERIAPTTNATYDLSGLTVLPGLIDVHDHIGWYFNASGRFHSANDGDTPEQSTQAAMVNMRATLLNGFTTIQSPGSASDGALRDSVNRGAIGPRILTSLGQISSGTPEQLRERVRRFRTQGADLVKIFASASIRDGGRQTMSQEQLDAACGEAKVVGIRTMVHAHSAESMRAATLAGCDQIEHGIFGNAEVLGLMAERGTWFSPQCGLVFHNYLENRERYLGIGNYNEEGFAAMEKAVPLAIQGFRDAIATKGLRVVLGSDAVAGAHGRNVEELFCRVQAAEQAPMDAIVSATSLSAQSMGLGALIGSVASGYEADLIAVEGNPLEDITALRRVVFVMKGGRVYRNDRAPADAQARVEWPVYGGDPGGMKYSPLADIDRSNVARLAPAWSWATGEQPIPETDSTRAARPGNFQATPLMIGDVLYLSTPYSAVVALDANSGRELWRHDTRAWEAGQPSNGTGFVHRGVAAWTDGREQRIFINSRWKLIAIDARTGKPIPSFGAGGEVDLTADLIWPVKKIHYTNTSPPVIYDNLVIVGNGVGDRLVYENDPPGDIQAFDVRTGKRVWRFSPIPQGREFGVESWENESWRRTGHTNVWAPFTVDVQRGLLYLPVGTPSNDWYGGSRLGDNLFAESIVCLDARTGRRVWHFQTVHHGLWDYDLPAPPNLITIRVDGREVDAVAVATKMGFLFVFDRVTGTPIWPIEERSVPASDVPGERAARTQPFPSRPAPFAQQGLTEGDVADFTPAIRALALAELRKYRFGPMYTPPSLQGTVVMPGSIGGSGWGGGAFDPETGILYVKATNSPILYTLHKTEQRSDTLQAEYMVDLGRSSLSVRTDALTDSLALPRGGSLPLNKPPYGTLTAIDLGTGDHRWQVPVGDNASVRNHPLLKGMSLPPLGVTGAPGPIVTRGGLVFLTGGGATLYAIDKSNGATLWEHALGRAGYSVPMTYRTSAGRQFVVIATGFGSNATLMAFALRDER